MEKTSKLKRTQKDRGFGYKKALDYPDTHRDNKLIAEFMGLTNHHNDSSVMLRKVSHNNEPLINEVVPLKALQYDTSWDWLMPVVRKCRQENRLDYFDFVYYALEQCDINITYKAVVEFIKNQNN